MKRDQPPTRRRQEANEAKAQQGGIAAVEHALDRLSGQMLRPASE
jgi:hypothetical protein